MLKRHIVYNIQGIGRDVASSPQNTTMAYSIKNMRLTPTKDSNALELTTERGTQLISVTGDALPSNVTILGYCTLLDYLVLFLKTASYDYIFRLQQTNNGYISKRLFQGNLNFDANSNIEATSYYENSNVQKIYWVDGINQPRMINIQVDTEYNPGHDASSVYTGFDFLQAVLNRNSSARIVAKKMYTGGSFTSGVIQYAYSLYGINALETPLLDITSLLYITNHDRGGAPNEQCSCSFEITIENANLSNNFDYIRVYSIQRNSLNGTPVARVVADIPYPVDTTTVTIVDDGNGGYDIDYNQLQYQRLPLHPLTLTQKDNVLFLGNYHIDHALSDLTKLYQFDDINISTTNWYPDESDSNYNVLVYDPNDAGIYPWSNQLNTESAGVKTFKYKEIYKLGVQFQDKYGNWSQPYFIKDMTQDKYPFVDNGVLHKPIFTCEIRSIFNHLSQWEQNEYVRIRPVVSLPSLTERSVLCQGVLNPTVFNITERCNKTRYALASWFFRPFIPGHYALNDGINHNDTYGTQGYGATVNYGQYQSLNDSMDIGGEIQGMYFNSFVNTVRHYCSLESADFCNNIDTYKNFFYIDQSVVTLNSADIDFNDNFKSINFNNYSVGVDGIIPLDSALGKYSIISQSPLTLNNVDSYGRWGGMFILNKSFIRSGDLPYGFYDYPLLNLLNNGVDGRGILCALNCWFDDVSDLTNFSNHTVGEIGEYKWNNHSCQVSYYVYPWNRPYLNNYAGGSALIQEIIPDSDYGTFASPESSRITNKILANIRYALNTKYFANDSYLLDLDNIVLCKDINQVRLSNTKLYDGAINQYYSYNNPYYNYAFSFGENPASCYLALDDITGYPITVQGLPLTYVESTTSYRGRDFGEITDNVHYQYRINTSKPREFFDIQATYYGDTSGYTHLNADRLISPNGRSTDAILISYKSTPHLVFQLNKTIESLRDTQILLPTIERQLQSMNTTALSDRGYIHIFDNGYEIPWGGQDYDYGLDGYVQYLINNTGVTNDKAYLLDASLYRKWIDDQGHAIINPYLNIWSDNVLSNQSNLYLRNWIPCGKAQSIPNDSDSNIALAWVEGDTYYQRYDCVKTKPYNEDSYQSVIEILSFMTESNINLDGRYDKNRGILDYTIVSDDNFNLFNDVYNQENNFFTYQILDPAKFDVNEFRNDIVWTNRKISGESIDQWTKLSSINQIQLDGNKGNVKALRKFNDNIYCFQDHAISRIRFNDRTAIATESGEPLQLAFSNHVDGCEYVNGDIGCQYGISCIDTENGIFFIDNDIPGIYRLAYNEYGNVNVTNLTKAKLMQKWFESSGNLTKTRMFFDKPVNEILAIHNNDYCLSYSCDMTSFQQFIDYEKAKYILTHNNWPVGITTISNTLQLWKLREGNFVSFFGLNQRPYGLELVASPPRTSDGLILDCIYDTLSYKADVFLGANGDDVHSAYYTYVPNESFDSLNVWSIYQNGEDTLEFTNLQKHEMSNLRKKFGSWFARIPRYIDSSQPIRYSSGRYNRERIRGNKLVLSLMKNQPNASNHKMVLKELSVDCFY